MKIFENLDINDLNGEIWKIIEDFPDYFVSNFGRIKSFKRYNGTNKRILTQIKNNSGYFYIHLSKNGEEKPKLVHRLVFEAFIGKLEEDCDAHHIDEYKENNIPKNLESKPHGKHMADHHKGKVFSEEHKKKISKNHVGMIGKHHSEKTRNKMSENHVGMIEKHHSEESKKKISENNPNKLTNQKIIDIQIDIEKEKLSQRELAKKHGVCRYTIWRIKNGKLKSNIGG